MTDSVTELREITPRIKDEARGRGYQKRARELHDDHIKESQRKITLCALLDLAAEGRTQQFFGLPGERWSTERLLDDLVGHSGTRFRGTEYSWPILERSAAWMPGRNPTKTAELLAIGESSGFKTCRSIVTFAHLSSFIGLKPREVARSNRGRKSFARRWCRSGLIWLDFTSCLCDEVFLSLERVYKICSDRDSRVPIAVTVQNGRDAGYRGLESRMQAISKRLSGNPLREFRGSAKWSYISDGGCSMATYVGTMNLRSHQ